VFQVHDIEMPDGAGPQRPDRFLIGSLLAQATAAGGGAGQPVTLNVTGLSLPSSYGVQVTPDQDAVCFVTAKTNSGFTVTLNPRLAANTLAAGHVDIFIFA
jgi:hypothetical protein